VQVAHVGTALAGVGDDALLLADGSHRAVLEVGGIDLALQGPGEQEAVLAGFAALLNALTFPVQIVVRLVPVDLEPYVVGLERRALDSLEEPLSGLALDHAAFLRRLGRQRSLIERRYYVVVPADAVSVGAARSRAGPGPLWRGLGRWLRRMPGGRGRAPNLAAPLPDLAAPLPGLAAPLPGAGAAEGPAIDDARRRQLAGRCAVVAEHLARCDLPVRRLGSAELAALFYACWCPELSRVQPLGGARSDDVAPVVRGPR
jgi:hypothetical protein